MPKLPIVSGKNVIKALSKTGFVVLRQRGSHVSLYRQSDDRMTVVPPHDELDKDTLKAILKDTGFTVEEFIEPL